jgi:CRP/FNR family cyclic AMP-dependent transcriptional regulator
LTPVQALAFDGTKLLQLCEDNPRFGYEFMRRTATVLADRLNAVRMQLFDLHGMNLPEVVLESD